MRRSQPSGDSSSLCLTLRSKAALFQHSGSFLASLSCLNWFLPLRSISLYFLFRSSFLAEPWEEMDVFILFFPRGLHNDVVRAVRSCGTCLSEQRTSWENRYTGLGIHCLTPQKRKRKDNLALWRLSIRRRGNNPGTSSSWPQPWESVGWCFHQQVQRKNTSSKNVSWYKLHSWSDFPSGFQNMSDRYTLHSFTSFALSPSLFRSVNFMFRNTPTKPSF